MLDVCLPCLKAVLGEWAPCPALCRQAPACWDSQTVTWSARKNSVTSWLSTKSYLLPWRLATACWWWSRPACPTFPCWPPPGPSPASCCCPPPSCSRWSGSAAPTSDSAPLAPPPIQIEQQHLKAPFRLWDLKIISPLFGMSIRRLTLTGRWCARRPRPRETPGSETWQTADR